MAAACLPGESISRASRTSAGSRAPILPSESEPAAEASARTERSKSSARRQRRHITKQKRERKAEGTALEFEEESLGADASMRFQNKTHRSSRPLRTRVRKKTNSRRRRTRLQKRLKAIAAEAEDAEEGLPEGDEPEKSEPGRTKLTRLLRTVSIPRRRRASGCSLWKEKEGRGSCHKESCGSRFNVCAG